MVSRSGDYPGRLFCLLGGEKMAWKKDFTEADKKAYRQKKQAAHK